jgi:hypothetical protein
MMSLDILDQFADSRKSRAVPELNESKNSLRNSCRLTTSCKCEAYVPKIALVKHLRRWLIQRCACNHVVNLSSITLFSYNNNNKAIDLLTSECPILVKKEYLMRHDKVCTHLHYSICKALGIETADK